MQSLLNPGPCDYYDREPVCKHYVTQRDHARKKNKIAKPPRYNRSLKKYPFRERRR